MLSPLKDLYYDHDSADADKKEDEVAKKKANRPSEYTPSLTDLITCSFLTCVIFDCRKAFVALARRRSLKRGRISSVGRAFDCRAGGRGFDSRGRTITQGLKITEK